MRAVRAWSLLAPRSAQTVRSSAWASGRRSARLSRAAAVVVGAALVGGVLAPVQPAAASPAVSVAPLPVAASSAAAEPSSAEFVEHGFGEALQPGVTAAPASQAAQELAADGEVLSARTRTSRTYVDADGRLRTTVWAGPVHFRDADGGWQKIDTRLVSDGRGGWRNAADEIVVSLPADLASPVTVGRGAVKVSAALRGASGPATAQGSRATYANALPGIDVIYDVAAGQVKESLRLATAEAASQFVFDVTLPAGLSPRLAADGSVEVVAAGRVVARLGRPFADDAAGAHTDAVAYALEPAGSGWALTMTLDRAWLTAPARAFPVVVDPPVTFNDPAASASCTLASGSLAASSLCGSSTVEVGNDGSSVRRGLLRFDEVTSVIRSDSHVSSAVLTLRSTSSTSSTARPVQLHALSAPFTGAATWNTRDGATAWTSPGGDFDAATVGYAGTTTIEPVTGPEEWSATKLVGEWVSGARANHGFAVRAGDEAAAGLFRFGSFANSDPALYPALTVTYTNRFGLAKWMQFHEQKINNRHSVSINLANGNLVLSTSDVTVAGAGLDLNIGRSYNSRRAFGVDDLGHGWLLNHGPDVFVQAQPDALDYTAPSGTRYVFIRTGATSYAPAAGVNADLATSDNVTFTLTDRKSGVKQTFQRESGQDRGGQRSVADRNGNTISYTYGSTQSPKNGQPWLEKITDTVGRDVTFAHPGGTYLETITDSDGRTYSYGYTGDDLTSFTDQAGLVTSYSYDSAHNLIKLITPRGVEYRFTYDTARRATSITQVTDPATGAGFTTTFDYTGKIDARGEAARGSTVVTNPLGKSTTYRYDTSDRIRTVTDALGHNRSAEFSPNNDVTSFTGAVTGAGGAAISTTSSYDSNNNLTSTVAPTKASVSYTYSGSGAAAHLPSTSTDSRNRTASFGYDSAGNLTSVESDGTRATTILDGQDDPATLVLDPVRCGPDDALGMATAAKPGSVCQTRDPLYTASAPEAHRTAYRYDSKGRLVRETPPAPSAQQPRTFTYDSLSRLTSITDGKAQKTSYGYDSLDRLRSATYADGTITRYEYDKDGNQTQITERDAANVILRTTNLGYDRISRPTKRALPEDTITLGYDAASNLTSFTDAGGKITYRYNAANQLTDLAEPGGSCSGYSLSTPPPASALCTVFGLDNDGKRTHTRYPGGTTQAVSYDDSARPKQITATVGSSTLVDLTYRYDDPNLAGSNNADNDTAFVTNRADNLAGRTVAYGYDSRNRLGSDIETVTATGAVTIARRYCYDAAGNRTAFYETTSTPAGCGSGTPTTSYSYDAANALVSTTGAGAGSFSYDANGNQTAAPASGPNPARTVSYNVRDQATAFTVGGTSLPQTYNGGDQTERLTSATSSTGSTSIMLGQLGIARTTPRDSGVDGASRFYTRDPSGTLISVRTGTATSYTSGYYLVDNLQSVLKIVDNTGAVKNAYSYTPYGIRTTTQSDIDQPFGYTGAGYHDPATGLIKLGLRYYDPTLGRFTQLDPTGQSAHYSYGENNPVNFKDPSGAFATTLIKSFFNGTSVGQAIEAAASGDRGALADLIVGFGAGLIAERLCIGVTIAFAGPTGGASLLAVPLCAILAVGIGEAVTAAAKRARTT